MTVEKGNKVFVEYEGRILDGEVFDSTQRHGGEPLEFIAGVGMMIKGFDDAVIGMEKGDEKEITIKPEEAYGERKEEYVQKLPKDKFPEEAQVGMMIGLPTPFGTIPARISEISEDTVTIDLNHELAGKTLVFKIKLVDFVEGDFSSELEHSCNCHECEHDECGCDDDEEGHACSCH